MRRTTPYRRCAKPNVSCRRLSNYTICASLHRCLTNVGRERGFTAFTNRIIDAVQGALEPSLACGEAARRPAHPDTDPTSVELSNMHRWARRACIDGRTLLASATVSSTTTTTVAAEFYAVQSTNPRAPRSTTRSPKTLVSK